MGHFLTLLSLSQLTINVWNYVCRLQDTMCNKRIWVQAGVSNVHTMLSVSEWGNQCYEATFCIENDGDYVDLIYFAKQK